MKKIFKLMSESGGSSNSRVAMAIAFKRARRKFPKNFGSSANAEAVNHYTDTENTENIDTTEASTMNSVIYDLETDRLQSTLVDSFEQVEISEEIDNVLCEVCQHESENFSNQEEVTASIKKEEFVNDDYTHQHQQEQEQERIQNLNDINNSKKRNISFDFSIFESSEPAERGDNESTCPDGSSYSFVWQEAPMEKLVDLELHQEPIIVHQSGDHLDKSTNVTDSDMDISKRIIDIQPRAYPPQQRERTRSHRCGKSGGSQDSDYHYKLKYTYNSDEMLSRSQSCTLADATSEHHCHCHHRHCCCRIHCCWSRCCFNWQPQATVSTPSASESSSSCRKSAKTPSQRRVRKEKCTICRKQRSSSPTTLKAASRRAHRESCSRDSGIFTNVRYENDEYEEEEEDEDEDNTLKHKDSLSILQEKFNKSTAGSSRKSSDGHRKRCSSRHDHHRHDDSSSTRSHKFCKRLLSRFDDASY